VRFVQLGEIRSIQTDKDSMMIAWRTCRAAMLMLSLLLAGCFLFHVGPTSLEGTEILEAAPKPPPVDSAFDGCGPDGSEPDHALNRLKNRVDDAERYTPIPWSMIAGLPWPKWSVDHFRYQWSKRQRQEVRRFEGAAVEVEGYIAGYRLEIPEPPNCYSRAGRHRDFHIWLSEKPGDALKNSVVVEMTPRVRVHHAGWMEERLRALQRSRVRVSVRGWLMLDQMHPELVGRNRRTLWEVHPVMHLDWQTSAGPWVSLDSLAPETP
jgi:hypothetical protein